MRGAILLAGLFGVGFLLAGCTTYLEVRKVADGQGPVVGYPYRLKFTQFDITVTRRIIGCASQGTEPKLKIAIKVDFTPKTSLDPSQFYVIDPRSLTNSFKTADEAFAWNADRSLKSVSATVEDQTATAVGNFVTAAGDVAMLAMSGAGERADPCKKVFDAIKTAAVAKTDVDAAQSRLDALTAELKDVTAKVGTMGTAVDGKTKRRFSLAIDGVKNATGVLAAKSSKLADALKPLSADSKVTWPLNGDQRDTSSKPDKIADDVLEKWNRDFGSSSDTPPAFDVYFRLSPLNGEVGGAAGSSAPPCEDRTDCAWKGLPYREPIWAKIEACQAKKCDAAAGGKAIASKEVLALQMGPMFVLPFEGPGLGSSKASAGFDDSGALATAGYAITKSSGLAASEVLKSATGEATTVVNAAAGARTKALKAQADELAAEQAVKDAQASLSADDKTLATKSFSADASLAQAQLSALQAQQALLAAQTPH
jgi:hypothetical protein